MIKFTPKELVCDYSGYRGLVYVDAIGRDGYYKSGYRLHLLDTDYEKPTGWLDCGWFVKLTGVKYVGDEDKPEYKVFMASKNKEIIKRVLEVDIALIDVPF